MRKLMNRVSIQILMFAACLSLSTAAIAQDTVGPEVGLKPYGSFHGGDIDSISMANLKLNLHIPIASFPQRGGKLNVGFTVLYHNPTFTPTVDVVDKTTRITEWSVDPAAVSIVPDFSLTGVCSTVPRACRVWEADGVQHQMGELASGTWVAMDASGMTIDSTGTVVKDRNGNRYTWINSADGRVSQIEDANGNYLSATIDAQGVIRGWTDTLGRSISAPPASGGTVTSDFSSCTGPLPTVQAYNWDLPGVNGGTSRIKVCIATVHIVAFTNCGTNCTGVNTTKTTIQSIVLPNNTAWTFEYADGGFGDLTKITLPTGGSLAYTWRNQTFGNRPVNAGLSVTTRAVVSRTVDALDGSGPHTWNYRQVLVSSPPNILKTTVTDPAGNDTAHTVEGLSNSYSLYETRTDYFQGPATSNVLVKSVATAYNFAGNPYDGAAPFPSAINVAPVSVTTTYPATNQVSKVETDYDAGTPMVNGGTGANVRYGNVLAVREYDYGTGAPGSLLKTTKTDYIAFSNSTYLANNLLSLPSQVAIFAGGAVSGTCASNGASACTSYSYDGSALTASGISVQRHASAPTGTARGNQTAIKRWLNGTATATANCPTSVTNGYVTQTQTFFDTGMVRTSTDPCGHATSFAYSSSYVGAFATSLTNAANQTSAYSYDLNSGVVTTSTDANQQTTSRVLDVFGRVKQIDYPDVGQVRICYTDDPSGSCYQAAPPYSTIVTTKLTSATNKISTNYFDGVGRLIRTQLADPDGAIYTDVVYDGNGRKASESNPYRATSEPTYGLTNYTYDPLDRLTRITLPDGSARTNTYLGNCTTASDEAGKSRRYCYDGIGRMSSVFEDPGGLNYETDYQYDVLGNLKRVDQKGGVADTTKWRTRTFTYDSLSLLRTANNPESGTSTYSYDADGQLVTKGDARPTSISYCYDALHRQRGRKYAGTVDCNTPSSWNIEYTYDVPNGFTGSYPVGRRTGMRDASGTTVWKYDVMGRITTEQRTIGAVTKTIGYTYNFDSSVATMLYPSGKTITLSYDQAGRPTSIADVAAGINYATQAHYAAHGAIASMRNGEKVGYTGVITTNSYNNRLQPVLLSAASPSLTVLSLSYDYGAAGQNNGNIVSIRNNRDIGGRGVGSVRFTYDNLNRLATAESTGTDCTTMPNGITANWGNSFSYDAWGNLYAKTPTKAGGCLSENLSTQADGKNRLIDHSYDAAGNMTDGVYTYDAEGHLATTAGVTYTYDGDGQRVSKSSGTVYWRSLQGETLAESGSTGTISKEYIYFAGKRIAFLHIATGLPYLYFSDHLGSASVMTSGDGKAIKEESDFLPFGGERVIVDGLSNQYKFTGKERDTESALDYFGARYYSSGLGRFTAPDPILATLRSENPQTLNRYAYTLNNPLRFTDSNGAYEQDVHRDLTAVLAQAAGFDAQTANAIAQADQGVDDSSATGPFAGVNARRDYHFTTSERRDQMWMSFERSRSMADLGEFLHAEQDSYSHEGYGPRAGHLFAGHAPDKTYNDPSKADRMARDTYDRLISAAGVLGIDAGNQIAWSKIDKAVGEFNKAKTLEEKNKVLAQLRDTISNAQREKKDRKRLKEEETQ